MTLCSAWVKHHVQLQLISQRDAVITGEGDLWFVTAGPVYGAGSQGVEMEPAALIEAQRSEVVIGGDHMEAPHVRDSTALDRLSEEGGADPLSVDEAVQGDDLPISLLFMLMHGPGDQAASVGAFTGDEAGQVQHVIGLPADHDQV